MTPTIIRVRPIIVGIFGIWLYFKIPTTVIAAMPNPDQVAYVIPTGIKLTTWDIR